MRRNRRSIAILAAALLEAQTLGSCAWLDPEPEPPRPPVVGADRDELFQAAALAFGGEAQEEWWVRSVDPASSRFLLTRVQARRGGDDVVEVEVEVVPLPEGNGYQVCALATRRTAPPADPDAIEEEAPPVAEPDAIDQSGGYGRRYRDEEIEAKVLDRIRASVSAFKVAPPRS